MGYIQSIRDISYNYVNKLDFINIHKNKQINEEILHKALNEGLVEIENINNSLENGIWNYSMCCDYVEESNKNILDPSSSYYRRGYVVVVKNIPLGHIKLKGNRTFLSWRSIKNKEGYKAIFGGVYDIPEKLSDDLNKREKLQKNKWGFISLDNFSIHPERLINEYPILTFFGRSIREKIRKERTLVEKFLQIKTF